MNAKPCFPIDLILCKYCAITAMTRDTLVYTVSSGGPPCLVASQDKPGVRVLTFKGQKLQDFTDNLFWWCTCVIDSTIHRSEEKKKKKNEEKKQNNTKTQKNGKTKQTQTKWKKKTHWAKGTPHLNLKKKLPYILYHMNMM